jgi:MFS family permease
MQLSIGGFRTQISDFFAFAIFTCINFLIFVDRGVIPGSSVEFNAFILSTTGYQQSDVLLGLLQSSFVIGLVTGALIFGHLSHSYDAFYLTGMGITIWCIAGFCSGLSYYANSYVCLLFARILSGFGEASLLCNIPPWIQKYAPARKQGTWLGIFYTAIPVGTAVGYAYSAALSASVGWAVAFFLEAVIALPFLAVVFAMVTRNDSVDMHGLLDSIPSHKLDHSRVSVWVELREILSSPVYVCLCFASAAQTAVLIGLSTFGSALLLGLGFFDTESDASTIFGILISIAGIIATPLGGYIVDSLQHPGESNSTADENNVNINVLVVGEFEPDIIIDKNENLEEYPSRHDILVIEQACMFMYWASLLSSLLYCLAVFCPDGSSLLSLLTIASAFCFSTNAGVALGQIASVPKRYQSFALAVAALILHGLGDVPSPILAGYIKDTLAPACVNGDSGVPNETNPSAGIVCRAQGSGLRWFMLWISLWLFWSVFWFGCAWWVCSFYLESNTEGAKIRMTWADILQRFKNKDRRKKYQELSVLSKK